MTLQQGKNVLLVALLSDGQGSFGFEPGTEYTVSNSGIKYTFSKPTIHVGDTFTLDISAENVHDLAGWQFDIAFDTAALKAIEVNEGEFLKTGGAATFFQRGTINNTAGRISDLSSASLSGDGVTGTGALLSVTFSAKATDRRNWYCITSSLVPAQAKLSLRNPIRLSLLWRSGPLPEI